MPNNRLDERVAIVTGASSGIGRAASLALARSGAKVVLAARGRQALDAVAAEIRATGGEALVVPTDVTNEADTRRLVDAALTAWGRVDILSANAGAYVRGKCVDLACTDFERSMAVNFYGVVHSVYAVLPNMLARGSGSLVLMSSMDGKKGIALDAPYVAAKFAIAGFGEVLRQELHGTGVRVTTVFPGRVDTPLIGRLRVPSVSKKIPPEAVAKAIVKAVHTGQPEVIIPVSGRVLLYVNTLSPRLGDWFARRLHLEGWEDRGAIAAGVE